MPIYNKPPSAAVSSKGAAAEIDDHASEAAKMKRTRTQAYFNSYDFDAIEVLSDDEDVGTSRSHRRQQPPLPQFNPMRLPPLAPPLVDASQRSASNLKTLSPHATNSPNSRRRQAFAALTLKDASNTLASARSATSSTSSSTSHEDHHHKYSKYFQRLGAFFVQGQRVEKSEVHPPPPPSAGCSSISLSNSSQSIPDIVVVHTDAVAAEQLVPSQPPEERISVAAAVEKVESGNFLLPRAMLKHQSNNGVGVGTGGNSSNSMPLAVSANTTHAGTMKSSLQNANNNNASKTNTDKTSATTTLTTTATIANMPTLRSSTNNKTRQIHLNSNEKGTGSSTLARHKKNAPISSTTAATARSLEQKKQQQQKQHQQQQQNVSDCPTELTVLSINGQNSQLAKMAKTANDTTTTATTTTITTTALTSAIATTAITTTTTPTSKTGPTTTITTTSNSHGKQQRERISSHQSHYSTDKSGSSGYYSSNVCSTYSIEDHIYCEPVIDVLDLNSKSKSVLVAASKNQNQQQTSNNNNNNNNNNISHRLATIKKTTATLGQNTNVGHSENPRSRFMNMNGAGQSERVKDCDDNDDDDGDDDDESEPHDSAIVDCPLAPPLLSSLKLNSLLSPDLAPPQLSENLRILESSIENLDRHLKTYPSLSSQEHITAYVQAHQNGFMPHVGEELKMRSYQHLPTIMESFDTPPSKTVPPPVPHWQEGGDELGDDSLLDIDLDSFLLVNERTDKRQRGSNTKGRGKLHQNSGIVNPSFLANDEDDEVAEALEENNYKCAKYINSCPEDAYRVESDIVAGSASQKSCSIEHFLKRYEDQIHFQNTRELLEDVRDKIRLLSRASSESEADHVDGSSHNAPPLPQELNSMIKTLKLELETYLARMNQHSELEIRQLCSGLVKNQHIVKMKKAFERRRSIASLSALESEYDFSAYEALRDGVMVSATGVPFGIRQQITSVRCASDPNFKMKRKSLTEIFPAADFYVENIASRNTVKNRVTANYENVNFDNAIVEVSSDSISESAAHTQLQRNLSFHQPILNQLNAKVGGPNGLTSGDAGGDMGKTSSSSSGGEAGDKDSIMEWHRKKPSAWELYYGTNRMNQSLLGKRGLIVQNTNQATLSYPSSRPESDFTLDLPRAEQLRIKMEKEKKFRQRCRYITSFLSLVFFLLTVMVVSLVLTRGKRMFGSMI